MGNAAWIPPLLLLIAFVGLVRVHRFNRDRVHSVRAMVTLYEQRLAAHNGEWSQLRHVSVLSQKLPHWAAELDVVGDVSLLRMLGGATTVLGHRTIEQWLLSPASVDEVFRRQQTVRELVDQPDFLDGIQTRSLLTPGWSEKSLLPFLEWAEKKERTIGSALSWWCRFTTAAVVISILLYGANVVSARVPVVAIIISVLTAAFTMWRTTSAITAAEGKEGPLESFSGTIALIEQASLRSPKVAEVRDALTSEGLSASATLKKLGRLLELAEIRYSPMMYAVLQALLLWDVHVLSSLERWRNLHGEHVRRWLGALGEMEALCALASLAHGNPDWCFPTVSAEDSDAGGRKTRDTFDARELAHPLIPRGIRVANDVTVGPPGTLLLVTGSNMSGKSTLLRAIGVNAVLAQAGAPVCARSLSMPPVVLATSVQVQDSLAQGVSRFMAELLRLKEVVDIVSRGDSSRDGVMPLYMLDEILQGTNSAERQVGARMVLARLVQSRCIGVVTTHDLALADSADLRSASRNVHFTEGVEEEDGKVSLSFEYQLRDGLATATNALKLMASLGLK